MLKIIVNDLLKTRFLSQYISSKKKAGHQAVGLPDAGEGHDINLLKVCCK